MSRGQLVELLTNLLEECKVEEMSVEDMAEYILNTLEYEGALSDEDEELDEDD